MCLKRSRAVLRHAHQLELREAAIHQKVKHNSMMTTIKKIVFAESAVERAAWQCGDGPYALNLRHRWSRSRSRRGPDEVAEFLRW
jgi:hypothetical protein